jgi:hypothetical protein
MALDQGFTPSLALYLLSIVKYVSAAPVLRIHLSAADLRTSATSIFGRIIPPYFADHFGSFNVVTICTRMSGVSILALWLPFCYHKSHAGVIIFALAYGFFSGAVVSLLMPCMAKAGSIETLGQRFGTFQIIISLRYKLQASFHFMFDADVRSNLTGLPTMGAILVRQSGHDYSGLAIFSGVSCIVGSVILVWATYFLGKTKGTWKV